MASAPVVPLPVLVERVDLHPPPGVGHRGGRGPRPSGPGTVSRKGGRPQTGNSGPSVPPLAAAEPRRRSHGPLPGPSPGPPPSLAARSSALLSRPGERGRSAAPTRTRSAELPTGSPFTQGQFGSQPCSRLRHDLRRAASRAAAASSGRRRHVFLPCTWPCRRRSLRSVQFLPLKASEADELALPRRLRTSRAT